jgi:hypothetical protein
MSKRPNSRPAQTATSNSTGQAASAINSAPTKAAKNEGGRTTKQARVVALLRSPAGATIAAMMKATEWQQHSVRGFLTGAVRKKLKLKLNSTKSDGHRVYRIVASGSSRSKPAVHARHKA